MHQIKLLYLSTKFQRDTFILPSIEFGLATEDRSKSWVYTCVLISNFLSLYYTHYARRSRLLVRDEISNSTSKNNHVSKAECLTAVGTLFSAEEGILYLLHPHLRCEYRKREYRNSFNNFERNSKA